MKTPSSQEHQKQTLTKSPGVFLDTPDDFRTVPIEMYTRERDGINALFDGDREKSLMAGGECAQRVEDLPSVQDLVTRIVDEATEIARGFPKFAVDS